MTKSGATEQNRISLKVNGIVQGVGFRPFVYRLAGELSLTGIIKNTSAGVHIELQGIPDNLNLFLTGLRSDPPPLAEISDIKKEDLDIISSESSFRIDQSHKDDRANTFISPDMATCSDCTEELLSPDNRRFLYPFINCTNCGPRYTIIRSLPYDRQSTTMADFQLCQKCAQEYNNPDDRRFHAQPNACPECGPHIWLEEAGVEIQLGERYNAVEQTVRLLIEGKIVAIKGLGGFHLAVDATNPAAVARLRLQKHREEKPLAIMIRELNLLDQTVHVDHAEKQLLENPQRPIVLLKKKSSDNIAENVAPGNSRLGIMLPYTPLHHILFNELGRHTKTPALVMTSANLSEEPIVIRNEEARERLNTIADYFLMHNRDILFRNDDSIVLKVADRAGILRRSRGYAPRPVFLKSFGPSALAVGGQLKNTICLTKENQAFPSQHIGDLENLLAYRFFEESVDHLQNVLDIHPEFIAHDLHPGYFSSTWATEQPLPTIGVQHHHAHMASCMAEWHLDNPVIAVVLDGTGFGYDKQIWGGEVLVGDLSEVRRYAALEYMPLPGGDTAIKQPWRTALGYLSEVYAENIPDLPFLAGKPVDQVLEMVHKKINTSLTSSCGRLFDAVAAICNIRTEIHYEAQAAIELMQKSELQYTHTYEYDIQNQKIILGPLLRNVVRDVVSNIPVEQIGTRFHASLIQMFAEVVQRASKEYGIRDIVLSGGSFQNEILLSGMMFYFTKKGFNVYSQKQVPSNDGGISLGQVAVARDLSSKGLSEVKFIQK